MSVSVPKMNLPTERNALSTKNITITASKSKSFRKREKRKILKHLKYYENDVFFEISSLPGNNETTTGQRLKSSGTASWELSNDIISVDKNVLPRIENSVQNASARIICGSDSDSTSMMIDNEKTKQMDSESNYENAQQQNIEKSGTYHDGNRNDNNTGNDENFFCEDAMRCSGDEEMSDEDEEVEVDASNTDTYSDECSDTSNNDGIDAAETKLTFAINTANEKLSAIMKFKNGVTNMMMILVILAISVRSKLTYVTTLLLFKMMNAMCKSGNLPTTMKSLWSVLTRNDDVASARHYYCENCSKYFGICSVPPKECPNINCKPKAIKKSIISYFIQLKITSQLEQMFKNATVIESLQYRFTRIKQKQNYVEDIYDGTKYEELCKPGGFLSYEYNFTFTLFTDGCKVCTSSKASAWPVMLMINEFSPHARKKYIILAGIWVDKKHPNLNRFLLPIIEELNSLYQNGIKWYHSIEKRYITSKFLTINCIVDSAARPPLLKMTLYNGEYGCTYCYSRGESVDVSGVVRVYPHEDKPSNCRTDQEMREDMSLAQETNKKVHGIKGFPAIACLRNFDLSCGVPVDSMHNVYLGVAKAHLDSFFQAKNKWYIGKPDNMIQINARLMKIRPPSKISRKPQALEESCNWKASLWRNWIQWFALVCLDGIISKAEHRHLALLSQAVYILNKNSIGTNEIMLARKLLKQFVAGYEKLFGRRNMRYNVHLLNHLTDSVQHWGPFWAHSAFPFESYNKKIIDKVTSANSRPLQIATRFLLSRFVENSLNNSDVPQEVKDIIYSTLTNELKTKNKYGIGASTYLFQGLKRIYGQKTTDNELRALSRAGYHSPTGIIRYQRVLLNETIKYTAKESKIAQTRYCDKYIYCETIGGYGEIMEIIEFHNSDSVIYGFLLKQLMNCGKAYGTHHIHYVDNSRKTVFLAISDNNSIRKIIPAIVLRKLTDNRLIISKLPNGWETD